MDLLHITLAAAWLARGAGLLQYAFTMAGNIDVCFWYGAGWAIRMRAAKHTMHISRTLQLYPLSAWCFGLHLIWYLRLLSSSFAYQQHTSVYTHQFILNDLFVMEEIL